MKKTMREWVKRIWKKRKWRELCYLRERLERLREPDDLAFLRRRSMEVGSDRRLWMENYVMFLWMKWLKKFKIIIIARFLNLIDYCIIYSFLCAC
jgi:hypothetical protein